jgi:starch phosphorylase
MKVLVNGGLNLSELDGWWAEAYAPEVGWALGDRREHDGDVGWDGSEADTLYGLLEREIVPEFYTRDHRGIPLGWTARMRESMARLTPVFSTNRAVRQYTEQHYLSAATAFRNRGAKEGALGADLLHWQGQLARHWASLRFGTATVEQKDAQYNFQTQVFLDDLDPNAIAAELYAEGQNGSAPFRYPMNRGERLVGSENGFLYRASIPANRPVTDFTPRLVPQHAGAIVPLEAPFILWHDSPSWR